MKTVFDQIVAMIDPGSSVLDLGCDDCSLLERLIDERGVVGRGVDISEQSIQACIKKGIGVFHGDLDEGLKDYATDSYDFVILSRTLQQIHDPVALLSEMLRVGKAAIVNFPNFGLSDQPSATCLGRYDAGEPPPALLLVQHSQHSLLHPTRFSPPVSRARLSDRARAVSA